MTYDIHGVRLELLKRRDRYALHASAMAPPGKGVVLVAGASGSGKTTVALALVRRRWAFLGDDTVFLDTRGDDLVALGFPDQVHATADTLAMFPELGPVTTAAVGVGDKHPLGAEKALGVTPTGCGNPRALVLPTVSHRQITTASPVGADDALVALAPNVLLTEAASSQAHLDALAVLARGVPCWRLEMGRDLHEVAATVGGLIL